MRRHPDVVASNPLRLLPRGAASYNAQDAVQALALGKPARVDVERDRRMHAGEFDRIMAALRGDKRPDRERALVGKDAAFFKLLFELIYFSGLRLRKAYRVRVDQLDMHRRSLQVQSSKQRHGRTKHRDIPMRPDLHALLTAHLAMHEYAPGALLFPFWDGTEAGLDTATSRLSNRFRKLFIYAQCDGLTEHDIRHETTYQWLLLQRQTITDGTATAKALDYSNKRWAALSRFVHDGQLHIDNNWIENQMRPITAGRNNWLFAGSLRAGHRAAAVMSLIQSAKLSGYDPYAYLKDVLTRLPTQLNSQIDELLPHRWEPLDQQYTC